MIHDPSQRRQGHCRDCHHWELDARAWPDGDWGYCRLARMRALEHRPDTRAFAAGDYNADLVTHATFGCVQYETTVG